MIFCVKKADNSANFAAGGIINHRTHHNSRQEQTLGDQLCGIYKAMSHATLPHMRELSSAPTVVA
jgi:hypothetical protein